MGRKSDRRRRRNDALKKIRRVEKAARRAAWLASPEYQRYLKYTSPTAFGLRRPNYSAIARDMFQVQPLPLGALPIYDRDPLFPDPILSAGEPGEG